MTKSRRKKHARQNNPQVIALFLIGGGLLVLGVVALLLIPKPQTASSSGSQDGYPSTTPAEVNYSAPDLSLKDLDGKTVSLKDYRDQVVLVNNWAIWCPPCKAEMPTLQAYFKDHHAENFTVIAIEAGESASDVTAFVKQFGMTFPVWPDPNQQSIQAFKNSGLPNSYVIDRGGQVRLAWTGAISREMLEKYVTPLLEE